MKKSLCELDEIKLLQFLNRAFAAVKASGWQPASLSILEWHSATCSNPDHRLDRPELGKLADELYGPFESEAVQPDKFESMFEALCVMFDADAKGNIPLHFRTFAHNETSNWELQDTPLKGVPVFGLYMVREGGDGFGWFLENVFCYPDAPEDAPRNQYGQTEIEAYLDGAGSDLPSNNGGEVGFQFARTAFDDPAALDADRRFSARVTFDGSLTETDLTNAMEALADVNNWRYVENAKAAILEAVADAATEDAREYFQGNAHHPAALLAA